MKIGLFFGSFNPIHVAHMLLVQYVLEHTDIEKIWFVISPHNPLKDKNSLLSENERLKMVNMAIANNNKMRASDIEFNLKKPSYTIDTLKFIKETYVNDEFVVVIGTDNLENLHKWKDYQKILEEYEIYAYSRPTSDGGELKNHPKIKIIDAHPNELSSTFIRDLIKENKNVEDLLCPAVWNYIKRKEFYK